MIKECPSCHNQFVAPTNQQYCKFCFKDYIKKKETERQKIEDAKWLEQRKRDKVLFENSLKFWDVVDLDKILSVVDNPLYVIGNGFDLLHGAKTSYYDFRDTLGKDNHLRWCLETYLNTDNVWANFEEALGHLNVNMMASTDIVDMWLDNYDVYNDDSSYANFYAAAEIAASPAITIADDLPKRLRMWIESVIIPTSDRPLESLIKDAPVLNFNYTEFVETLYGVDNKKICYIHGCRKKIKGRPKDKLILGHIPGANDSEYEFHDKWKPKNPYKRYMIDIGQEIALKHISYCDNELTKHCDEIIKEHRIFFDSLNATDVISIGHSLSEVDWDYFDEIVRVNGSDINWYISCYGLRDIENIEKFTQHFSISYDKVHLFRLDGIKVQVETLQEDKKYTAQKERILCRKGRWIIRELNGRLSIYKDGTKFYSLMFPGFIRKAILFDENLLIVCDDVYLLKYDEIGEKKGWIFVRKLEPIQNQGLFNRRLDRVLHENNMLIFVYNNRIRKYSLGDGELIENKAVRNARGMNVPGEIVDYK